jgi:hypothetical protein
MAKWFSKDTVQLNNGANGIAGDQVGALVPYQPKECWDGITQSQIDNLILEIDRGIFAEGRLEGYWTFYNSKKSERFVGDLIALRLDCTEAHSEKILKQWKKNKRLVEFVYWNRNGDKRKGCGSNALAAHRGEYPAIGKEPNNAQPTSQPDAD